VARNVKLQILRGILANIPVLSVAEAYFATDTQQWYSGAASGNLLVGPMYVYNAAGVKQSQPHIVADKVTLSGGGTATVTLVDGAAFTNATSYVCLAGDVTAKNRAPMVTQVSGTSITFVGNGGDTVHFICIGT